jgi:hypothetical protein
LSEVSPCARKKSTLDFSSDGLEAICVVVDIGRVVILFFFEQPAAASVAVVKVIALNNDLFMLSPLIFWVQTRCHRLIGRRRVSFTYF